MPVRDREAEGSNPSPPTKHLSLNSPMRKAVVGLLQLNSRQQSTLDCDPLEESPIQDPLHAGIR